MTRIRTVAGDIGPDVIDRILPHEHLLCDFSSITDDRNHILNNPHNAILELEEFNRTLPPAPGRAHVIVETTLPDLGRDPAGLARIAAASGTHVVMGTGWYLEPYYPPRIFHDSTATLAAEMIDEIVTGVEIPGGRRVRAGLIGELGTHGSTISPAEERVLRAGARAAQATGVGLSTHAFLYPTGIDQLDVLEEEGLAPSRVAIGHVDTFLDREYHLELAQRGAYLQFDTCGRTHLFPDSQRVDMIEFLLSNGWERSILLSSDRCHRTDLKMNGGLGYEWAVAGFCDLLRAAGLTGATIDQLTHANPLAFLGGITAD